MSSATVKEEGTLQIGEAADDLFGDLDGLAKPSIVKAVELELLCIGTELGELFAGELATITYLNGISTKSFRPGIELHTDGVFYLGARLRAAH